MSETDVHTSWLDPQYVSTIVGVIATGALFFYSGFVDTAPSPETIGHA